MANTKEIGISNAVSKAGVFGKGLTKGIGKAVTNVGGVGKGLTKDIGSGLRKGTDFLNRRKPKFIEEFKEFIKKYNVISLAVAFVMGGAVQKLVSAMVADIIMPIIGALTPSGDWKNATLTIGPMLFKVGDFISVLLDFLIMGFVIFFVVKLLIKDDSPKK